MYAQTFPHAAPQQLLPAHRNRTASPRLLKGFRRISIGGCLDGIRVKAIARAVKNRGEIEMSVWDRDMLGVQKKKQGRFKVKDTGFDKLEVSLTSALEKAKSRCLNGKWDELGEYLMAFGDHERDASLSSEIIEGLGDLSDPEVICTYTEMILGEATCYRSGLSPAVASISAGLRDLVACMESLINADEEFGNFDLSLPSVAPVSPRGRRKLFSTAGIAHQGKQARVVETCIKNWIKETVRVTFSTWRIYVRETREATRVKGIIASYEKKLKEAKNMQQRMNHRVEDLQKEVGTFRRKSADRLKTAKVVGQLGDLQNEHEKLKAKNESLMDEADGFRNVIKTLQEERAGLRHELNCVRQYLQEIVNSAQTGTHQESCLQDHIMEVLEKRIQEGRKRGEEVTILLGVPLLKTVVNCIVQDEKLALSLDEDFIRPAAELNAMVEALRIVAPSIVQAEEYEEVLNSCSTDDKANAISKWTQSCGILVSSTPDELSSDDGRGVGRYELFSALALRIMDPQNDRELKPLELQWHHSPPPDVELSPSSWGTVGCKELFWKYKRLKEKGHWLANRHALITRDLVSELKNASDPEAERKLTAVEMRDIKLFTTVTKPMLECITKGMSESEAADASNVIYDILITNYRALRRIYKYYGNLEHMKKAEMLKSSGLSLSDMTRLLKDCYATADVAAYWPQNTSGLSPQMFITVLIQMSQKASTKASEQPDWQPLSADLNAVERVRLFFETVVIPNARYISTASFREAMNKASMRQLLKELKSVLQKVFVYYASGKATNDVVEQNTKEMKEISYKEFKQFLTDTKCYDETCTQYEMQMVFTKMQEDYDLVVNFEEFMDLVCTIAVYKDPAPYLPLHIRVRHFVVERLLPHLAKKLNLRLDNLRSPLGNPSMPQHETKKKERKKTVVVALINRKLPNNKSFDPSHLLSLHSVAKALPPLQINEDDS